MLSHVKRRTLVSAQHRAVVSFHEMITIVMVTMTSLYHRPVPYSCHIQNQMGKAIPSSSLIHALESGVALLVYLSSAFLGNLTLAAVVCPTAG